MTWETRGGTGVGPAVIRYCFVNGLGVTARGRLASVVAAALEVALQVIAERLEVESRGGEGDEGHHGDDAGAHPDAPEPERRLRLPGAAAALPARDPVVRPPGEDPRGGRARQRE